MTEKNQEQYKNKNAGPVCEKEIFVDKVRDHRLLTGKYRGPAHRKCKINVTQKQSNLFHMYFTISVIMIVIYSSNI